MALMTACPACNTRFKVVPDQLRLHHGLVRCGACDHVFDANNRLESLVEPVDSQAVNSTIESSTIESQGWIYKPAVQALSRGEANNSQANAQGWTQVISNPLAVDDEVFNQKSPSGALNGLSINDGSRITDQQNIQVHGEYQPDNLKRVERRKRRPAGKIKPKPLQSDPASLDGIKSQAIKQSLDGDLQTGSLKVIRLLCLIGFTGCFLQIFIATRLILVDKIPQLKPVLTTLCSPLGCEVEPAAWLSALTLDALSLSKSANTTSSNNENFLHKMQATVRNSSQIYVKTPDVELTISNAQGALIARKTLKAQQLAGADTLAPSSDWLIDSEILINQQTVGYTARLVYLP